ncbi:MAG: protein-glutamate O-methyltransferase CheR [Thaumarchaeota archaeon]|nr:protein-glutamate O-methyltransferase CheR [Nitrososphaerota archaeon]
MEKQHAGASEKNGRMPYEGFFEEETSQRQEDPPAGEVLDSFSKIFEGYGLDFTRYKANFLKRRLDRRMSILGIGAYQDYADFLKNNRKEFEELFRSFSINVTNFFRDPTVYEVFSSTIVPSMISNAGQSGKIRVWSAGCASGEEPYSIAIMFSRVLEKTRDLTVEIIASDISQKAIEWARLGRYPSKSLENLPVEVIGKHFTPVGEEEDKEYEICQFIKNMVSFGMSDILSSDARGLDAIFCRNVLIYYEKEAQDLILSKFHQILKPTGYLVLGMDETMLGRRCEKLFSPLMARERIYQKIDPAKGTKELGKIAIQQG